MAEIEWRDVVGYEGLYEVSSDGQVRNKRTLHVLGQYKNNTGYYNVSLYGAPPRVKQKSYLVHRLVAMAFIDNTTNLSEIDHIDGCCTNNNVSNLRWCTRTDNAHNPITMARYYVAIRSKEHRERCRAIQADKSKAVICEETKEIWSSVHAAARALGLSQSSVQQSCKHAQAPTYRRLSKMGGKPVKHFMFLDDWNKLHGEELTCET